MKIQLASDLHLEFLLNQWSGERIIAPAPGADVLVLAGDIADGGQIAQLFANWPSLPERIPTIVVGGNHEFYGHAYGPMIDRMRQSAALCNIHLFGEQERGDWRYALSGLHLVDRLQVAVQPLEGPANGARPACTE